MYLFGNFWKQEKDFAKIKEWFLCIGLHRTSVTCHLPMQTLGLHDTSFWTPRSFESCDSVARHAIRFLPTTRQHTRCHMSMFSVHCAWRCCAIQMSMSVPWITEAAVQTLTAPIHLETLPVPVWKDMSVTDLSAQVKSYKRNNSSFCMHPYSVCCYVVGQKCCRISWWNVQTCVLPWFDRLEIGS